MCLLENLKLDMQCAFVANIIFYWTALLWAFLSLLFRKNLRLPRVSSQLAYPSLHVHVPSVSLSFHRQCHGVAMSTVLDSGYLGSNSGFVACYLSDFGRVTISLSLSFLMLNRILIETTL